MEIRVVRILATGLVLAAVSAAAGAKDLSQMTSEEVITLQRRLTDAGCYRGTIDGNTSDELNLAIRACPDQEPQLRIEVGMHTSQIKNIGVDAECKLLATGSDDKTIRLWSLPDGKAGRVLRVPIDAGNGGKIYSVALSRDGRWLAAGGWMAASQKSAREAVYLYDLQDGNVRRFEGLEDSVTTLAVSMDGERLAAGLGGGQGIRVFDRETGTLLGADRTVQGTLGAVVYGSDGRLFASASDGFIRSYGLDLELQKETTPHGKQPFGISLDPTGKRLLVGYSDTRSVSVLDASTLKPVTEGDTKDLASDRLLSRVAWLPGGTGFVAGSSQVKIVNGKYRRLVRRFAANGKQSGPDILVSDNTLLALQTCGSGIAYGAADPAFGLIDRDGRVRQLAVPKTVDMRGKANGGLTVGPDGQTLGFGLGSGADIPVWFSLSTATLTIAKDKNRSLAAPKLTGLKVTDWLNSVEPKLDGKPIALKKFENSRSLAVRRDGQGFILGTDWYLRSFDSSGKELWRTPSPSTTWGVNLAQDDRIIVTAFGDGTIRWYREDDGKELLALFVNAGDRRWVAWTPGGYYMASPGAEAMIGWHLNRGWNQEPDFFPASRFRDRFSRPDIVQAVLKTLDEDKAVEAADAAARRKPEASKPIAAQLPPVVTIVSPRAGTSFAKPEVTLDFAIRSPSGLPIDRVDVLVDGRPLSLDRGLSRPGGKPVDAGGGSTTGSITVALPERDVEVSLIARAGTLAGEPASVKLAYAGKPAALAEPDVLKPKLYLLAIGIADYQDPALKLGLAGKDARDFAKAFSAQAGGLYSTVETKILIDRDATRSNILKALDWLERQATSRDVAAVFLAGHGQTDLRGDFWFLPSDVDRDSLRASAISQDELKRTLQALPSKALLFLDACHAGRAAGAVGTVTRGPVDINTVVNDLSSSENGVVTFASSTGRQLSQENPDWGNGAFTKALVEGIGGAKASLLGRETITLSELDAYVVARVKELTRGEQSPVMTRPNTVTNFPIALVRR